MLSSHSGEPDCFAEFSWKWPRAQARQIALDYCARLHARSLAGKAISGNTEEPGAVCRETA
jgi:hypothetical protein